MADRLKKLCTRCGKMDPQCGFYRNRGTKDGYRSHCVRCVLSRHRERDAGRQRHTHKRFGLTPNSYDQMVMTQCGLCAVCGDPEKKLGKYGDPCRLAVHHDHSSGNIVALLCSDCNLGIGKLKDSSELLVRAAALQQGR